MAGAWTGRRSGLPITLSPLRPSAELKAKDLELRNEYGAEGININRIDALESEIKKLKAQIHAVADKLGIPACCTV